MTPMPSIPRTGRSSLLANTAVLSATTLGVSAANYGLNVALARLLPPAEFGDANLAINLVLAAAVVAATLQLVSSKMIATHPESAAAVTRTLALIAGSIGLVVLLAFTAGAWVLADVLRTSTPWMFVVLGLGLPIYFMQAVYRGVLQGDLRISRLALSYGVEAAVRVVGAIALVWAGFGVVGACVAITLSFVASAAVVWRRRGADGNTQGRVPWLAVRAVALGATILLVGQVLINNGDLVLSKVFFDPVVAGLYASAALVGRAVFFLSWSVVQAVFPVAARASLPAVERRRAVLLAVGMVAVIGGVALVTVFFWSDTVSNVMFGSTYAGAASLLFPYVLATTLFALANLLGALGVATGRLAVPIVVLAGGALQTILLISLARTPEMMVWLQVIAMSVTALGAALFWTMSEKRLDKAL